MFAGAEGHEMPRGFRLADAWKWGAQTTSPHGQALDLHLFATRGFKGDAQPEDSARALEAGFERHIAKPIDPDTMRELLL